MIVLSHPTGNTFVKAALLGLTHSGILDSFHTTISISQENLLIQILPPAIKRELLRRNFPISKSRIFTRPLKEVVRLISLRLQIHLLNSAENGWASIDSVYDDLDSSVATYVANQVASHPQSKITGVYGYEDGAFHTFKQAKELGLKCIYELPIAYWQTCHQLLKEEAERLPEWEPTLLGNRDSAYKLSRKTQELEMSDLVICPSKFVYDTLPSEIRKNKQCLIAKFGSPELIFSPQDVRQRHKSELLRLLFVGSLTQRKGLADLMSAIKLLNRPDIELVIMGQPIVPMEFYKQQLPSFTWELPRTQSQVLHLMQSCDALVLPSIVEGRALVQQEALACGLPIIVTPNAGGEDLVEEGRTGFLVPIRDPIKLAEKIQWLADNKSVLPDMSRLAMQKASEITWSNYQKKIVEAVMELEH